MCYHCLSHPVCVIVQFISIYAKWHEQTSKPCCSVELQTKREMSRRNDKYLSLFGHIDGTVLDMHATARFVFLSTYNISLSKVKPLHSALRPVAYAGLYHGRVQQCPKGHAVRPEEAKVGVGF